MNKRAILYARVSSDDRAKGGLNLAGQLDLCREFATQKGYSVISELPEDDRGISGAAVDRPALRQALEMARKHEFDILVVREIDRFARSLANQLAIEQEFKQYGVEIDFALETYIDTPEGDLHKHIKAVIAEYERLKINERTVRGRKQKVKSGNVLVHGKPPYGYRLKEKHGRSMLLICQPEARIVTLIFKWYVNGDDAHPPISTRQIAFQLSEMGIPVPDPSRRAKNIWSPRTILQIITNETYAGIWHYGKFSHVNGKRIAHPEHKLIPVQITAIVSREIWIAAQSRRSTNTLIASRNTRFPYLLSKRLTCAICGTQLAVRSAGKNNRHYLYYFCPKANSSAKQQNSCMNRTYYRADYTDNSIWQWQYLYLSDPNAVQTGLEQFIEIRTEEAAPLKERMTLLTALIEENRQQLQRIIDLYISGKFAKKLLMERKNRLQAQITNLVTELTKLKERLALWELSPEKLEEVVSLRGQILTKLYYAQNSFELRQKLIDLLDVRAALYSQDSKQYAKMTFIFGSKEINIEKINPTTQTGELK